MSTIKSQTEHLTLNADGSGKEIKFQCNGTEVAKIDATGFVGAGSPSIDDNGNATAITIDSSENVGIGTSSPSRSLHITSNANTPTLRLSSGSTYTADYGPSIEFQNGTGELLAGVKGAFEQSSQGNYGVLTFSTRTSDALGIEEKMRIDSAGRVTMPSQPAFSARSSASGNTGASGVQIFATVDTNIGGHFSSSTGKFTAPVSGMYHFSGTILSRASAFGRLDFQKNGTIIRWAENSRSTVNYASVTSTLSLYLSANDYVNVNSSYGTYGAGYNYFSGFLIG